MRLAAIAVAALALSPAALAALPPTGKLVPGRSLAGIRLGDTQQQVRRALGSSYGVCTGCARSTWYFNAKPFDQHGLGVEFTRSRVSAVYTIAQPTGWIGPHNLVLGEVESQVTSSAGPLVVLTCTGYDAWVADRGAARTVYYLFNGSLWGFGLVRAHADPCR
jgi:hypothetical protein